MAKIKITQSKMWDHRVKKIDIFYDGQEIGSVYKGEVKEFDIREGSHQLKAKSGWFGSRKFPFSVRENETMNFNVSMFKHGNLIMSLAFGLMALHFILVTFFNITFVFWIVIPVFLVALYYLTLGRKNYLVISENRP